MKLAARNGLFLVHKGEYIYFCTKDYQEGLEKTGKLQHSIGDRLKQLLKQKALVVWGNLRKIEKVGEELGLENPLNESGAVLEGLAAVMDSAGLQMRNTWRPTAGEISPSVENSPGISAELNAL